MTGKLIFCKDHYHPGTDIQHPHPVEQHQLQQQQQQLHHHHHDQQQQQQQHQQQQAMDVNPYAFQQQMHPFASGGGGFHPRCHVNGFDVGHAGFYHHPTPPTPMLDEKLFTSASAPDPSTFKNRIRKRRANKEIHSNSGNFPLI